ncbi:glutathione peroxidase [Enterococcus dispar]|jgi:glutathione peroxidase|uniref:glutathione peroxidase n=1 Tax=Enterococcus dispar TaxID=44009 RepID=UPI00189DAD79|nr:glutathione peroxidase [Enterococcus dispar]MCU7356626.1 glutathione peroxidase [Enterococcus dispar]MDT2704395.1 glutathione peroxidase [Enterococcus dispar]
MEAIYDYTVKDVGGKSISMKDYKGKVLLIVNTATGCGFAPQYEGLENLYQEFQKEGLEILDFPCNQFGNQAPGSNEEIQSFCQLRYHTTFKTFAKIKVNGEDAAPLYQFLKSQQKGLGEAIKWNFTKFVVDRNGNVVKRFASATPPEKIVSTIEKLL